MVKGDVYAIGTVERKDGMKNYIREDGKIVLDKWVDELTRFQNFGRIARVSICSEDGEYLYNFVDAYGRWYYLDKWISEAELKRYEASLGFET